MKIAICDDLKSERDRLSAMLRDYLAARGLTATLREYESGEALTEAFTAGAFGLVLLDIYMEGMTGVETAWHLRTIDPDCVMIFTTTSREHGADAFDLEAFHYLVKPVTQEKLFSVLDKWYRLLCEIKTVTLKCGRTERQVFVRDILYIEVLGHRTSVHTVTDCFDTPLSLSAMEGLLPGGEFCKPIRYCLVALRHVRTLSEDHLLLMNGTQVPFARKERERLRQTIAAYRLRALRGR